MIRALQMTDLPWVRALYADFLAETNPQYPRFGPQALDRFVLVLSHALREDPTFHGTVATDDNDRLIGFLLGNLTRRLIGEPEWVLAPHVLYVVPAHRGQGISRQLAREFIGWYREHYPHVDDIEIYARADDPQWQQRGFTSFLTTVHGSFALADAYVVGKSTIKAPVMNGPDDPMNGSVDRE